MPSGPENTTVVQGDKAILECRVHSTIKSNIMWLKKLEKDEEEKYIKNSNVIEVGKEKFKLIQKKKQTEDKVKVNARGVEILNTMEIHRVELRLCHRINAWFARCVSIACSESFNSNLNTMETHRVVLRLCLQNHVWVARCASIACSDGSKPNCTNNSNSSRGVAAVPSNSYVVRAKSLSFKKDRSNIGEHLQWLMKVPLGRCPRRCSMSPRRLFSSVIQKDDVEDMVHRSGHLDNGTEISNWAAKLPITCNTCCTCGTNTLGSHQDYAEWCPPRSINWPPPRWFVEP